MNSNQRLSLSHEQEESIRSMYVNGKLHAEYLHLEFVEFNQHYFGALMRAKNWPDGSRASGRGQNGGNLKRKGGFRFQEDKDRRSKRPRN